MNKNIKNQSASLRTLSIGGATFDLFIKTDDEVEHECDGKRSIALPLGGKINVSDVTGVCGGGANNTAVGLSRLGCDAAFCGVIGNDQWGKAIHENMEKEGVDTRYLTIIEHEPSSFGVVLSAPDGERSILVHKSMDRHFHDVTFNRDALGTVEAVFLNHIHEDTCSIQDDIVHALAAAPQIHLSWNPGGHQIRQTMKDPAIALLLQHTDLLLLNKEEALAFANTRTVKDAIHRLIAAGVKNICVTDGPHGAIGSDGSQIYHCPAPPAVAIDATGAGDAFGTGATWALISGKDLPTALKAGTINAMSVVGKVGAQEGLLTETQIQTKLAETDIAVVAEPF